MARVCVCVVWCGVVCVCSAGAVTINVFMTMAGPDRECSVAAGLRPATGL